MPDSIEVPGVEVTGRRGGRESAPGSGARPGGPGAARASAVEVGTLRVNTLITLALSDFLLSGLDAARARLDHASLLAERLGRDELKARIAFQRAQIHGRAGELAVAWQHMRQAVSRPEAFTAREQCSVHISRGMLALSLGETKDAEEAFAQAAEVAHEHGYPQQEVMARHNEGYAAYLRGDLPQALTLMRAAERLSADLSAQGLEPTFRLDKGRALLEAGLVAEAIDQLERSCAELDPEQHLERFAQHELELARAYRLSGRVDQALAAANEASAAFERLGAAAWAGRATLAGLRAALDQRNVPDDVPDRAVRTADGLTRTASDLGDAELADNARLVAAQGLLLRGDVELAHRRMLDRTLVGTLSDELDSDAILAAVLVAQGNGTRAKQVVVQAARRLAAGQQSSASLDLRTARAVHGSRLADLDLSLAFPRGSGAVLEALERWRSATDRLPSLGRPEDEQLAVLTERLRSVQARLRSATDLERLAALQAEASRLERDIRDRDWALTRSGPAAGAIPIRVREAKEQLVAADRDLVWFFRYESRLCAVAVIGGRASLRDLMPIQRASELAQRIRVDLRAASTRHLGPLSSMVWGSLRASAAELDDAILRGWRASRGLVLVTCPEVSGLPWALLPSMAGRPFTVALSLTSFARRTAPRDRTAGVPGNGTQSPQVHITVGPAVPRAGSEASEIATTWGDRSEVLRPSRRDALLAALGRPGVVHVAAHGHHETESPLFSSLALHDGPVFAHELQRPGVRADHVVLSACDVGLATSRPGHESLGLALSLLSLGARSTVAAVAPVPDDVAAAAMTRHHALLASGRASDEALATAIADTDPVASAFLNLGGRVLAP
ncbi:CHAT domain-containing protein [Monashia sp. NPDC004114]